MLEIEKHLDGAELDEFRSFHRMIRSILTNLADIGESRRTLVSRGMYHRELYFFVHRDDLCRKSVRLLDVGGMSDGR